MGTNYALHVGVCKHCNRGSHEYHMCKLSVGYHTAWQGYLEADSSPTGRPLTTVKEWVQLMRLPDSVLYDEYGSKVDVETFLSELEERRKRTDLKRANSPTDAYWLGGVWCDEDGNDFCGADFC